MRKAVRKKEKKNEIFNVGIGKKNRIIKKRISERPKYNFEGKARKGDIQKNNEKKKEIDRMKIVDEIKEREREE